MVNQGSINADFGLVYLKRKKVNCHLNFFSGSDYVIENLLT